MMLAELFSLIALEMIRSRNKRPDEMLKHQKQVEDYYHYEWVIIRSHGDGSKNTVFFRKRNGWTITVFLNLYNQNKSVLDIPEAKNNSSNKKLSL